MLAAQNAADIDLLHEVLDTPDFVVVDRSGARHSWEEVRARAGSEALFGRGMH